MVNTPFHSSWMSDRIPLIHLRQTTIRFQAPCSMMIYLPPLRRLLVPTLFFVTVVIFYRSLPTRTNFPNFILHQPPVPPAGVRIPISNHQNLLSVVTNASENHVTPPKQYFYSYEKDEKASSNKSSPLILQPAIHPTLHQLYKCPMKVNNYTGHVRLSDMVQNVSQIPPDPLSPETRVFWNPTIIALPYWSKNQYLVVSRIVTDGLHQENVVCEANVCYVPGQEARPGGKQCTDDDLKHLGPSGGMRCATSPVTLSVPPTPAERCVGKFAPYVDIPGFHDPRIFWSGRGEPLMIVNTQ